MDFPLSFSNETTELFKENACTVRLNRVYDLYE